MIAEQGHWLGARAPSTRFGAAASSAALLGVVALLGAFFHRRRAEAFDRHAALQRELFQSQQLDGLGRLAGGIAHDFNNLLSVVATRAELAASVGISDAERTQDLEAIRADVNAETGKPRHTPLSGLALMVFFVYACQCMSTLAVVRRETNSWKWTLFMFFSMTAIAYVAALLVFQGGRALGFG